MIRSWSRPPHPTLSGKISALTLSCISFTKYSTLYETKRAIAAFASPQAEAPAWTATWQRQTPCATPSTRAVCSSTTCACAAAGTQGHSAAAHAPARRGSATSPDRRQAQTRLSNLPVFAPVKPCPPDLRGSAPRSACPRHAGLLYPVRQADQSQTQATRLCLARTLCHDAPEGTQTGTQYNLLCAAQRPTSQGTYRRRGCVLFGALLRWLEPADRTATTVAQGRVMAGCPSAHEVAYDPLAILRQSRSKRDAACRAMNRAAPSQPTRIISARPNSNVSRLSTTT